MYELNRDELKIYEIKCRCIVCSLKKETLIIRYIEIRHFILASMSTYNISSFIKDPCLNKLQQRMEPDSMRTPCCKLSRWQMPLAENGTSHRDPSYKILKWQMPSAENGTSHRDPSYKILRWHMPLAENWTSKRAPCCKILWWQMPLADKLTQSEGSILQNLQWQDVLYKDGTNLRDLSCKLLQ